MTDILHDLTFLRFVKFSIFCNTLIVSDILNKWIIPTCAVINIYCRAVYNIYTELTLENKDYSR